MSGSTQKVPCTYEGCSELFSSVQQMKKHKSSNPHHDYCTRCDEDYEDEERLLIHKIKSNKHIVCPICGLDFRSESGRDSHIRQNHRAEQNIACYGCKDTFKSASGLIRHIEDNECSEISNMRLLQEQSKKLIIKEALKAGEGSPLPLMPNPGDFDDIEGGVKINSLELRNREAMANQPKPGNNPTESSSAMPALKHWPQLSDKKKGGEEASDLMEFTPEKVNTWKGKAMARPVDENGQPLSSGQDNFGFLPDAGQTLRILDQAWDPTKFFNSFSGQYVCPCGAEFTRMKEFGEHILTKSRARRHMQCPGCLRIFKSTAALVAHCESSSVRCSISDRDSYGQIFGEMTGDVVQAVGYNADGTVKYEAGKLELPKKTTIGTDLQKLEMKKW